MSGCLCYSWNLANGQTIFSVSAQQVKTQSKLCNVKKNVPWSTLNDRINLINFHYSLLQKTYKQNLWRPASESPCSCRRAFSVPDRKKTCYQTDYTDYQYMVAQQNGKSFEEGYIMLHLYIQFCAKSWLKTLAIEPPSSPCSPAPTLRRRLHFRWLSWAAKHAWQQQTLYIPFWDSQGTDDIILS